MARKGASAGIIVAAVIGFAVFAGHQDPSNSTCDHLIQGSRLTPTRAHSVFDGGSAYRKCVDQYNRTHGK